MNYKTLYRKRNTSTQYLICDRVSFRVSTIFNLVLNMLSLQPLATRVPTESGLKSHLFLCFRDNFFKKLFFPYFKIFFWYFKEKNHTVKEELRINLRKVLSERMEISKLRFWGLLWICFHTINTIKREREPDSVGKGSCRSCCPAFTCPPYVLF